MTERTILIVEDDEDIRELLVEILGDEGYQVLAAADGLEALERLRANPGRVELVVLDLMMPRMNGAELRAALLAEPRWARIPVVVLTAGSVSSDRLDALQPVTCVRKPVDIERLLAVVGGVFRPSSLASA